MSPKGQQFPQFADLPPEIQLQVWEAASSGPSIHVFDVCLPSSDDQRSLRAFTRGHEGPLTAKKLHRYLKYGRTAFLDTADPNTADPSLYAWHVSLGQACVDASSALLLRHSPASRPPSPSRRGSHPPHEHTDANTVYLAGPDRHVWYDNSTDVLHLRLGPPTATGTALEATTPARPPDAVPSRLGALLDAEWSGEMAETLRAARRVALAAADTWTDATAAPLVFEEAAFLACTLHRRLETLYLLVEPRGVGAGKGGEEKRLRAADLQTRGGALLRELRGGDEEDEGRRRPDAVQGVGVAYREVFDLEGLGWDDSHPTYVFARLLDEAVRSQQGEGGGEVVFQGLRILVAEPDGC